MSTSTVTARGQTTVPKEVRQTLQLRSGSRLDWRIETDGTVRVIPRTLGLLDVCGFLAAKPRKKGRLSLKEMDKAIARAACGRNA